MAFTIAWTQAFKSISNYLKLISLLTLIATIVEVQGRWDKALGGTFVVEGRQLL